MKNKETGERRKENVLFSEVCFQQKVAKRYPTFFIFTTFFIEGVGDPLSHLGCRLLASL